MPTDERIKSIEIAYDIMKERGWGFTSNGHGFGDPAATWTMVGPYDGYFVEAWGVDPDPVVAVQKALARSKHEPPPLDSDVKDTGTSAA